MKKNGKPIDTSTHLPATGFHLDKDAKWGGFINIRMTDEQKLAFSSWYEDNLNVASQILDELLGAGMKVGFSYDAENQCYICTFTGKLLVSSDERYCVTTRAGTLVEVIALAVWKHVYLARGDYGGYKAKTGNFANWG